MIDKMFDEFGDNPMFKEFVNDIIDTMVIDINNDLKFGELALNETIVGATLLVNIRNQLTFEFLRTINMKMNGNDDITFANVVDFINKLEAIYVTADEHKKIFMQQENGE